MIPARKSVLLHALFKPYARRALAASFHTVLALKSGGPPPQPSPDRPLLVLLNHSSWWDVLLGYFLAENAVGGDYYTVMDERQLRRYRFFAKLGIVGIDRTTVAGARDFLNYFGSLMRPGRTLWITPQGEFVSSSSRPIRFEPGFAFLAQRLGDLDCATVAMHYEFWDERRPEAFVSFSPAERICLPAGATARRSLIAVQEDRMDRQLDTLVRAARERDISRFEPLLKGRRGIDGPYDAIRTITAAATGRRAELEHGAAPSPPTRGLARPPVDEQA